MSDTRHKLLNHYEGWEERIVGCAEVVIVMEDEGVGSDEEILVVRGVIAECNGGRVTGYGAAI